MQTNSKRNLLMIGLDGGTWTVLKPAIEQGCMPFLKSLCDKGWSGILESTIPAITPAAWGGFQTGKNAGKTGVFDFSYWTVRDKETHYVSGLDLGETLWDILSAQGKRIAVINVPMTYPPKPVNGVLISGLMTPSIDSEFTWPPELKQSLRQAVPDYHIFDLKKIAGIRSEEEYFETFVRQMTAIIDSRTQAALWLLQREQFDLLMVHFQATDVLQHVYWHYLDPAHPLFDPARQTYLFEHFYRVLDGKIRDIYDAYAQCSPAPLTVVISDHGFQTHTKRVNLGNWLVGQGYLTLLERPRPEKPPLLKKITRALKIGKIAGFMFPAAFIRKVDKKYVSKEEVFDWNKTAALSVGRSNEGFIYLLAAKEEERTRLAEEIRHKLMQIQDPRTGEPVVKKVWRKEELYRGGQMDRLPDLIIEPADHYSFTGFFQPGEGLFHEVHSETDMHMGKHHRDGILVASGNTVHKEYDRPVNITDLAPTILYYLGLAVPGEMDGAVHSGLFTETISKTPPAPRKMEPAGKSDPAAIGYSSKEQNEIEQRLKDLGYL